MIGEYRECGAEGTATTIAFDAICSYGRTDYQSYLLLDTPAFGKVLVIDGSIQVCEADAFIYHEALCWMPMLYHPDPKRILIAGGASGWAARTCLQFPCVEHITQVEIDYEVLQEASGFFGNGSLWEDPRVELHIDDIWRWLSAYKGPAFDVILLDLTDPLNGNAAMPLQTPAFYHLLAEQLGEQGVLAAQAGTAWFMREQLKATYWLASKQFRIAHVYECPGATPRGQYAFVMAGQNLPVDYQWPVPKSARFITQYYAANAFWLPPYIAEILRDSP